MLTTMSIYLYKVRTYHLFVLFENQVKPQTLLESLGSPWSPSLAHWSAQGLSFGSTPLWFQTQHPFHHRASELKPARDSTPLFVLTRKIILFVINKLKGISKNVTKTLRKLVIISEKPRQRHWVDQQKTIRDQVYLIADLDQVKG